MGSSFSTTGISTPRVERVIIDTPTAIRLGDFTFRETAYGVVKRLRFIVEHIEKERIRLGVEPGRFRILDLGCGTGTYITIPLANLGYEVTGLDTDGASIERALENAVITGSPKIQFHCGRLEESDFSPFHFVISSEVIEHQQAPVEFLRIVHSRLSSDGVLILTTPNGSGYYEIESWIAGLLPGLPRMADHLERSVIRAFGSQARKIRHRAEYGGLDPVRDGIRNRLEQSSLAANLKHNQRFSARELRNLVRSEGFKIVAFRNNTFLAGNIFNALVRSSDLVLRLNSLIADYLPEWLVADWLLAAKKAGAGPREEPKVINENSETLDL